MCNEKTLRDNANHLNTKGWLSRRRFGQLAAGLAAGTMLPLTVHATDLAESEVVITTPDGEADGYFVHPTSGQHPAILVWPDILGLRSAFREMGKRLAQSGYAVLVVNPFYRSARAPVVPEGATFQDKAVRNTVLQLRAQLNTATYATDTHSFIAFLDDQVAVDSDRRIGTIGYCMGGPIVMNAAAVEPDRIGAVGSFHGGGLVTEDEDSPHLRIPETRADYLIAIAENDHEKEPEVKDILSHSFAAANLKADVEVYEDALHGWCVIDSPVYHHEQAEKAWQRMLAMFDKAL